VGGAKGAIVRMVDITRAVRVEETVGDNFVVIRRLRRGLDRERRRPSLDGCSIDAFLIVQKRHPAAPKGEAVGERARVRDVLAELGDEE
jgi:hypothetical protein